MTSSEIGIAPRAFHGTQGFHGTLVENQWSSDKLYLSEGRSFFANDFEDYKLPKLPESS